MLLHEYYKKKAPCVKISCRAILSGELSEIRTDDDNNTDLERKITEDLKKLKCSENVVEEAVQQWINGQLEFYEVLNDDDIASQVTCGSEETRNFEKCLESNE